MLVTKIEIPADHPRRESLEVREKIIEGHELDIVATAGLLAHGRGEAFDYFIGEKTTEQARETIRAAVAAMLTATHPVISVNGNACSLVPEQLVELSKLTSAPLEINLFYYRKEREYAILEALHNAGAEGVLGTHDRPSVTIPELSSNRRKVDPDGIGSADVVLVPLEDGDRTEALRKIGKYVITIDLNPVSRTSIYSNITIVDNIVRALPLMVEYARELRELPHEELSRIVEAFDNDKNIRNSIQLMIENLSSKKKMTIAELREGMK
ncbi:MAG: phosphopantothenate/pantothenate synthetase [Candidatus Thorarchaeota archaeon]